VFLAAEAENRVPRIGGGRTYLVELGFFPGSVPMGIENLLFKLRIQGLVLLAAHPERVTDHQRDRDRAAKIRTAGMLFQLDVMSLVGKYGRLAERFAFDMLENGMIDLASTDIHRADDLKLLEKGMTALHRWDAGEFIRLFSTNPSAVLDGREIPEDDE
jgi:tyrosine-protein phosphatase YwqE